MLVQYLLTKATQNFAYTATANNIQHQQKAGRDSGHLVTTFHLAPLLHT
jgi:hypothetical protein